ncbi:formate dehydrogenase subunit alpha [Petrotoga miotherma DSM 10691]|uniref:Formate dehydrogenase subunit alpha n=1 Tax=Petrotoga miotherma DSM 10691 TaxID=1434326 RepID=A0A2K1P3W8_9BACT|nr:formate dehydrogenase subunit alpha [Petrotoga miotherma]PNR97485.1 formate dehydrogenase subunit alpha [Petrotoga miotherma DSM 10691]
MIVTINHNDYEAEPGQTILQVAKQNGIYIPTICHSPHLSDVGSCRMCLVELENNHKLVASCVTPVTDGMRVLTDSKRVIEARKTVVDLLVSDHPLDCMTCEANGNCVLQDLAYEYGIKESTFGTKKLPRFEIKAQNEFIQLDPDKCILCGKCVRTCKEIQMCNVLDFVNRGFETKVSPPFDQDLGGQDSPCVFCGQCVEMCPTGALTYIPSKGKGRYYEFKKTITTCPYCGVGCQLELRTKDNKIIQVGSVYNENSPNPHGESCVKGRFGYDFVNHPDRLTDPLIKRNGHFEKVSWEEALDYVAEKLLNIKEKYGSDSIGGLSSAKCTNEENYIMQKFMRAVVGTNSVDHCARLCHASTVVGLGMAFGSGAMTNSISEIEGSNVIFVIGSNPTENHPVIGSKIKKAKKNGTHLIVADPRKIELSEIADISLHQKPGTDVALINGIMNVIINEGLLDKKFIEERTEGFESFIKIIEGYTPSTVSQITGVPADKIIEAAKMYGSAEKAAIYFAMGITQHKYGTNNVLSLTNLALLTGNVGFESTGVNPLRGQNNVQGACDVGALPDVYPGYQKVSDPKIKEKFENYWGVKLTDREGLTLTEMFEEAGKKVKALYIMGENPFLSDPDQEHIKKALESLNFLIVQDIFLTETAQFADVVLPAASFAEKEGTFTNTERRIQRVRKAINSPGRAKADWEILTTLANKMGYEMKYNSPSEIMDEIARVSKLYGGISYERLEKEGLQWPCPDSNHPGTKYLHKDSFSRGKGKFFPVEFTLPEKKADEKYNFILMTGRMLYHFHTGTMTRRSYSIDKHEPDAYVEINIEDARKLGIKDKEKVRITSSQGTVETYAKVGERVKPGQLFMPFHYAESPANRLTNRVYDLKAKIPELKITPVNLEKAEKRSSQREVLIDERFTSIRRQE